MKYALLFLSVVLLSGCAAARAKYLRVIEKKSPIAVRCPEAKISDVDRNTWKTTGCGREWSCHSENATIGFIIDWDVFCDETGTSKESVNKKAVIDQLSLETNCPKDKIKIDRESEWVRGTERSYRLSACGEVYVCTSASGRIECKAALVR